MAQSMNTVMDDNKMLTLASNERIPLTPSMRLLLEINHMIHCSPATVSRGGVIYMNAEDVGWKPVSVCPAKSALQSTCMRSLSTSLLASTVDCNGKNKEEHSDMICRHPNYMPSAPGAATIMPSLVGDHPC